MLTRTRIAVPGGGGRGTVTNDAVDGMVGIKRIRFSGVGNVEIKFRKKKNKCNERVLFNR